MVKSMQVVEMFSEFYKEWMRQLKEDHLVLLLKAQTENSDDAICVDTINKLTAHHKEFYKVKWAHGDVLGLFSPIWLTSFEKAFLWVTDWKPSMAFQLLDSLKKSSSSGSGSSLAAMTEDQVRKIEALVAYIKAEEEKVDMEMERQQRRIADPNLVRLSQLQRLAEDSEDSAAVSRVKGLVEVAIGGLVDGMEAVMKMGDCVRLKTLKGVLEVLNPTQGVEFLAAMCTIPIKMRELGKIREKN